MNPTLSLNPRSDVNMEIGASGLFFYRFRTDQGGLRLWAHGSRFRPSGCRVQVPCVGVCN